MMRSISADPYSSPAPGPRASPEQLQEACDVRKTLHGYERGLQQQQQQQQLGSCFQCADVQGNMYSKQARGSDDSRVPILPPMTTMENRGEGLRRAGSSSISDQGGSRPAHAQPQFSSRHTPFSGKCVLDTIFDTIRVSAETAAAPGSSTCRRGRVLRAAPSAPAGPLSPQHEALPPIAGLVRAPSVRCAKDPLARLLVPLAERMEARRISPEDALGRLPIALQGSRSL